MHFFLAKKEVIIINTPTIEKKDSTITYPTTMTYGENILLKDSASGSANYSFGAILGKDAKLKIVLTNLYIDSSNQIYSIWGYGMGQQGWVITDYNFTENTQSFTSNKDGEIIADFNLGALGLGASGKCKMEFYENSSKITKTKYLKW